MTHRQRQVPAALPWSHDVAVVLRNSHAHGVRMTAFVEECVKLQLPLSSSVNRLTGVGAWTSAQCIRMFPQFERVSTLFLLALAKRFSISL